MSTSRKTPPSIRTLGDDDLLSIGDVAEATGLTPEALRMWERRYGRPKPERLPSGHRRYRRHHVLWLNRVTEAIARGHRPHQIIPLEEDELSHLLEEQPAQPERDETIDRMLEAVRRFNGRFLKEQLLSDGQRMKTLDYLERRVAPLMLAVGESWRDGVLDIAHEHYLTEVLEDVLRQQRQQFPVTGMGPAVLLATMSGEQHGLGLQMIALLCASKGLPVHLLGTETPLVQIASAAQDLNARVVGLTVSLSTGGVQADRMLAQLREMLPDAFRIVVGGAGMQSSRRPPRGVERITGLTDFSRWIDSI